MSQTPPLEKLLPIHAVEPGEALSHHWDYLYEPDAKDVVDGLMTVLSNHGLSGGGRKYCLEMAAEWWR
ncbi:MAG: hypothetical protein Ct9H300mP14_10250 [Gammaproteobacteria bacterium]|nr:MAG: hypothetical protein Ct9H300mP14_10250 [Gammaproteobacteria bacterium]